MGRNVFTRNIIIASSSNGGRGWWNGSDSLPVIKNNIYYNYVGKTIIKSGVMGFKGDENVIYENPLICGTVYSINPDSPVYKNPVNFSPITGHWGPPGYTIPGEEVTASCPLCK